MNSTPLSPDAGLPVKQLQDLALVNDDSSQRDSKDQSIAGTADSGNKRPSVQSTTGNAGHNSTDPVHLPNGSVMLPPFPRPEKTAEVIGYQQEERPPIQWPEPTINRTIPRTRSFICQATTIAGMGGSSSTTPNSPLIRKSNNSTSFSATQTSPVTNEEYPEIDYLQLILQASTRVYDVAIESPLQFAKNLSAKLGRENKVYLKREDMQPVCFSFKVRGAYNKYVIRFKHMILIDSPVK